MSERRQFERVALVVNAGSRTGQAAYDGACEHLTALGLPPDEAFQVSDATRMGEVLQHVSDGAADLVVVGGGDGTISTAVDYLAHTATTLGVLPLGTANDFARTLGIPSDLRAACETIAHGKVVDVDLGQVGSNHFVNVASAGLAVAVTATLSPGLKRRLGPLAYPAATLRAYRNYEPFTARLEFPDDGQETVQIDDVLQLSVGNGRHYGGGNVVSPTAGIDDHLLDVTVIRKGRLRDHVSIARLLKDGSFVEHDNVWHRTTRRVVVNADPVQSVNVDGEVVASTPQEVRIDRNAIDVLVPQASSAAQQDRASTERSQPTGMTPT